MGSYQKIIPHRLKKRLQNIFLFGDNVECPICGKKFETFLPFGVPPSSLRPNARCPKCNSLERTRIYWKFLLDKTNLFSSKKEILHVAPEPILFKKFNSNALINYFPVDKFTKGYRYPKGTINMDITQIKYPDNKFDFILCSHVLEHIINDTIAMSELFRVMKVGGWGIIQVPIDHNRNNTYEDISITSPKEREKAFGQYDHVRIYGNDYFDRLSSVGFEVEINEYAKNLSKADQFKYGFGNGELLCIVKKTLSAGKKHPPKHAQPNAIVIK